MSDFIKDFDSWVLFERSMTEKTVKVIEAYKSYKMKRTEILTRKLHFNSSDSADIEKFIPKEGDKMHSMYSELDIEKLNKKINNQNKDSITEEDLKEGANKGFPRGYNKKKLYDYLKIEAEDAKSLGLIVYGAGGDFFGMSNAASRLIRNSEDSVYTDKTALDRWDDPNFTEIIWNISTHEDKEESNYKYETYIDPKDNKIKVKPLGPPDRLYKEHFNRNQAIAEFLICYPAQNFTEINSKEDIKYLTEKEFYAIFETGTMFFMTTGEEGNKMTSLQSSNTISPENALLENSLNAYLDYQKKDPDFFIWTDHETIDMLERNSKIIKSISGLEYRIPKEVFNIENLKIKTGPTPENFEIFKSGMGDSRIKGTELLSGGTLIKMSKDKKGSVRYNQILDNLPNIDIENLKSSF